jgi:hypothetical protein
MPDETPADAMFADEQPVAPWLLMRHQLKRRTKKRTKDTDNFLAGRRTK